MEAEFEKGKKNIWRRIRVYLAERSDDGGDGQMEAALERGQKTVFNRRSGECHHEKVRWKILINQHFLAERDTFLEILNLTFSLKFEIFEQKLELYWLFWVTIIFQTRPPPSTSRDQWRFRLSGCGETQGMGEHLQVSTFQFLEEKKPIFQNRPHPRPGS